MIANFLTICRIILSLLLLIFQVFSPGFYVCYLLSGITDMVDGTVARKLGTESEFGEKLDTVADIVFVIVAAYKLLPEFNVGIGIWIWIGVIAIIKISNIILGFLLQKKMVAVHSWANKITGLLLFVFPFTFTVIDIRYSATTVCLFATFAALQEGYFISKNINMKRDKRCR